MIHPGVLCFYMLPPEFAVCQWHFLHAGRDLDLSPHASTEPTSLLFWSLFNVRFIPPFLARQSPSFPVRQSRGDGFVWCLISKGSG